MVPRCGGSTYKQGRIGEDRGSKEMDRCPLTNGGTGNGSDRGGYLI
jgi:hypothetical protein